MYTQFIQVFVLEKYNVEERVDGEIRRVTGEARRAVWNVIQDAGWCAVAQVGDVVGLVTALMPAGEEEESDGGEECDDDGVGGVGADEDDEDEGKDEHDDGISEGVEEDEDYGISFEGETSGSEPDRTMQEMLQNTDARRLASDQESGIEPVSSFASLSSIRSSFGMYEEDETLLDDDVDASYSDDDRTRSISEAYLRDLTQMLRTGLYVYASLRDGDDGGDDAPTNTDRPFRLSSFSYHPAASPTATDPTASSDTTENAVYETTPPSRDCFVFTPPPTAADEPHDGERMANDSVVLPLDDVVRVRKAGTHSVEIRTASRRRPLELWPALGKSLVEGTLERARSVGSDVSEKDFVELMKNWSDGGNTLQGKATEEEEEGDFVFAEMVLLDGEDRDTLFVGLRTLLKTFDRRGDFDNSATEKEKKNTKFKENVRAMESDGITKKRACEMEKVEDTESKKEVSSANALDESSIVSTPRKERLSDDDNEDIKCNLSKALGNGTSDHESFFFGELLLGGMAVSSPRQQQ